MKFISHRGNLNGPNKERENKPDYIDETIKAGYGVEIDIWLKDGDLYLGHDGPEVLIDINWLLDRKENLWVHCKNVEALSEIIHTDINCFYHVNDTVTLTSNKTIWAFPGKQPIKNSIAVMPEFFNDDLSVCDGICTDYVNHYKEILKK